MWYSLTGWAAEHGVVKVSHSLELQPATDLSRSHKPAAAWADKPGHDSQEGEAVGEGEEEGDGSAPQESGEGDGEDRDEEEYKFPEDLIEYLLFSQLGPALVVLTVLLLYVVVRKITTALSRRGVAKDQ